MSTTKSPEKKTVKKTVPKKAAANPEETKEPKAPTSLGMKHGKFIDYGYYMLRHVKEQLGDAFDLDAALDAAHTYDENWQDQLQFVDMFMNTQKDVRKSKRDYKQARKVAEKKAAKE